MPKPDRAMAERLHAIVKASAPALSPRTWYGMPAYAKDGNVVCFFQGARKFKTRYATFGFSDKANLDEGTMWRCGSGFGTPPTRRPGFRQTFDCGRARSFGRDFSIGKVRTPSL